MGWSKMVRMTPRRIVHFWVTLPYVRKSTPRGIVMDQERSDSRSRKGLHRRSVLKAGAAAVFLTMLDELAWSPMRSAMASTAVLLDIQFDLGSFIAPVTS